MRSSFIEHGFADAEFLAIDNSQGNSTCAYRGFSQLLDRATGEYLIMCHQDVLLLDDGAAKLEALLEQLPPDWAVAGNAGAKADGQLSIRISDPHGEDTARGPFPAKVETLDENFLVVRRSSGVRPSSELSGFHLYGADVCLRAELAACSCYVIDFHLRHLSAGKMDAHFFRSQQAFERHWGAIIGSRTVNTTCTTLSLRSGFYATVRARWKLARMQGFGLPRAALAVLTDRALLRA